MSSARGVSKGPIHSLRRRAPLDITPEHRESLAQSLFSDYLSTSNFQEALSAAQELAVPGFMRKLAEVGGRG